MRPYRPSHTRPRFHFCTGPHRYLSLVVHVLPWYTELYNTLWLRYLLKFPMLFELCILLDKGLKSYQDAKRCDRVCLFRKIL